MGEAGKYEQWHRRVLHTGPPAANPHIVLYIDHGSSLHQRIHEVQEPTVPHPVQGRASLSHHNVGRNELKKEQKANAAQQDISDCISTK